MKEKLSLVLFWAVQLTWGFIQNFIGALIFVVLYIASFFTGNKPKRFHQTVYFEIGNCWGGFNMGFVSVVSKTAGVGTLKHEHGHFIQTFFFGPFMTFIQIASFCRYWYREYIARTDMKKYITLPAYDSIWFEGQATKFGDTYLK